MAEMAAMAGTAQLLGQLLLVERQGMAAMGIQTEGMAAMAELAGRVRLAVMGGEAYAEPVEQVDRVAVRQLPLLGMVGMVGLVEQVEKGVLAGHQHPRLTEMAELAGMVKGALLVCSCKPLAQ